MDHGEMKMLHRIAKLVNASLGMFGLEVRMKRDLERASVALCIREAVRNGLNPATVIDVGAASGTPELYEAFPDAHLILVEPLEEFAPALQKVAAGLKRVEVFMGVAASQSGSLTINVHSDLVGSSIYREEEDSDVNGIPRTVSSTTLDQLCKEKKAEGPYLIKVDTQGAELEVLKGADTILPETVFVILETSFFNIFKGGPQFFDCVSYMKDKGFVVYDLFDMRYRPLDGALVQVDLAFVPEKSPLRRFHFYATRKQRAHQNKFFGAQSVSEDIERPLPSRGPDPQEGIR
jgi:FkbM family methyltransferase